MFFVTTFVTYVCSKIITNTFSIELFLDLREPIIYKEAFGVYNNYQHVASKSDRKFGTYQFGYYGTARSTCKNTHGAKTLPVICLKDDLSRDEIKLPFDLKYFILIGGFLITFTLWSVATKCSSLRNCITSCTRSQSINNVQNDDVEMT